MLPENFERSLRAFVKRRPFKPFSVEFVSGELVEVDHPEAVVMRGGVAVFVNAEGVPILFDHESVSRVIGATDEAATA